MIISAKRQGNMLSRIILRISFILAIALFVYFNRSYAAVNPNFTPKWNVGDSWDIVIRQTSEGLISLDAELEETSQPPHTWVSTIHFNVINHKEIDSEMCYILELTYKNPNNQYEQQASLQLYIREGDFTLKKILEINKEIGGSQQYIENYHDNGHDFLIFRDALKIPLPCDFPNFPATNTNEERTVQVSSDSYPETQKIIFVDANTLKVELSTPDRNGILKVVQIWEKGKPWWSSVKRTLTYHDITKVGHPEVTEIESDPILVGTDLIPPELTLSVTPTTLWPPNHEMVEINPAITITDNYDRFPEVKLYSVESNEPDDAVGEGDGHTTQDIQTTQVWDDKQHKMADKILLRAERDGKGSGRVYTITYTATDFSGNAARVSAAITVPHDIE